jgi:hypothetical protein
MRAELAMMNWYSRTRATRVCLVAGQSLCTLKDNGSGGRQRGEGEYRGKEGEKGRGGLGDVDGGTEFRGGGTWSRTSRIGEKAQKEM